MKEKDLKIISCLRKDARMALTAMSKSIQVPVSTIFDRLKLHEAENIIKHTTLFNFEKVGYNSRSIHVIKAIPKTRDLLKNYLMAHDNVNNIYLTNSNYDFIAETIFRNSKETRDFVEELERNFQTNLVHSYSFIEDIAREKFMTR